MTNLRNMITTGLAALVLASGCGTSSASLKAEEVPWTEGVVDTGVIYLGIGCSPATGECSKSSSPDLARGYAESLAVSSVFCYVVEKENPGKCKAISGSIKESVVIDVLESPQDICVKVAVPYSSVVLGQVIIGGAKWMFDPSWN